MEPFHAALAVEPPMEIPRRLPATVRWRLDWSRYQSEIVSSALLAVLVLSVLYPLALLLINSFRVGTFGAETDWGLQNWVRAFQDPRMRSALGNTIGLAVVRQGLSLVIGLLIAWLLTRTNLPGRKWLEFGFWVAVLLPTLPMLLGWLVILDPRGGVIAAASKTLPFLSAIKVDLFSWWGIVLAHLFLGSVAVKVFLLAPVLRNIDFSLEEAARISGANMRRTVREVIIPLMLPAIVLVTIYGAIRSMQAFEVELILGGPQNIQVYSTLIYDMARAEPPQYGAATALGMLVLLIMAPLMILHRHIATNRNRATVTGRFNPRLVDLGPLRWPLFALVATLVALFTVIPMIFVVVGSFMKTYGMFTLPSPWTLNNWQRVWNDSTFVSALLNTLYIAGASTLLSLVLFFSLAYVLVRVRFRGNLLIDYLTWVPSGIPGIVMSLAWLWLVLSTPFLRPLFGTIWILILVLGVSHVTLGVQMFRSSLVQISQELEEAARIGGEGKLSSIWKILVPLLMPTIVVVGLLCFSSASGAVSVVALIASGDSKPLALLQLEYASRGYFEPAAVVSILILALSSGMALLGHWYASRVGLSRVAR